MTIKLGLQKNESIERALKIKMEAFLSSLELSNIKIIIEFNFERDLATKRKRGRRKKDEVQEQYEPKDQNKYFIDVSKNKDQRDLIQNILNQANNKNYGREIILKDLVLIALPKITAKEIEKLQENSLSEMERVSMALDEYNKKSEVKLTLGEFLVKKLAL